MKDNLGNKIPEGVVYWFTGLSSAGKTTIASLFCQRLRKINSNVIFLDGDVLREIFGNDLGHSAEDRKKSARRNARLSQILSRQGFHVICATISLFEESFEFNRNEITNYKEIYLRVPMSILVQRDPKQIYAKFNKGEIKNVMGMDIPAAVPSNPTIILDNDGQESPQQLVDKLWNALDFKSPSAMVA